jgi:hypothetical protein
MSFGRTRNTTRSVTTPLSRWAARFGALRCGRAASSATAQRTSRIGIDRRKVGVPPPPPQPLLRVRQRHDPDHWCWCMELGWGVDRTCIWWKLCCRWTDAQRHRWIGRCSLVGATLLLCSPLLLCTYEKCAVCSVAVELDFVSLKMVERVPTPAELVSDMQLMLTSHGYR